MREVDHIVLPATHTNGMNHPAFTPRKHSPNGATRARLRTSDCSLLLIYRPRNDESLSWPS